MQVFRTMTEMALRELRRAVIEGALPPGSRLIPQKLESEMGLGRVAFREAIRELVGSGLVESFPNKGTYVASAPSPEEIEKIFYLRSTLESAVAYEAAKHISSKDIHAMEELHQEMAVESQTKKYFMLNREFHLILHNASGWKSLCKVLTQLIDQVLLFRSLQPFSQIDNKEFIQDHCHILEGIKSGNPEEVKRAVAINIERGLDEIRSRMVQRNST